MLVRTSPRKEKLLRKETKMKTFSQTRVTFLEILAQLKRLESPGKITQAMRIVKEREAGKLCYQAEEDLPQAELSLLRDMLNLRASNWEAYKQACLEGLHS
jgi:hypothetical protein